MSANFKLFFTLNQLCGPCSIISRLQVSTEKIQVMNKNKMGRPLNNLVIKRKFGDKLFFRSKDNVIKDISLMVYVYNLLYSKSDEKGD